MSAAHRPHRTCKLTEDDVRLIRELTDERERLLTAASKVSDRALAEKFEVSKSTIHCIAKRYKWAHIA